MKKIIICLALCGAILFTGTGCNQVDRVTENISKEADNFNIVR